MKRARLRWWLAWLLAFAPASAQEPLPQRESNYSLRNEVEIAVDKGLAWLQLHQNADGSWEEKDRPASTALALIAFLRHPAGKYRTEPRPDFVAKGFAALRAAAKADGSISGKADENFDTSLSLLALLTNNDPKDAAIEKKARAFLIGLQAGNRRDTWLNGGFVPGPPNASAKRRPPDLRNTLFALEALRAFKTQFPGTKGPSPSDCNWKAAAAFLSGCQNLRSPDDAGGFTDAPYSVKSASGATTCAGLLGLIHTGVEKKDACGAALNWIRLHYTLEKNPDSKSDGYYEYLSLFARSLVALDLRDLDLAHGRKIDWARDEALKLLDLQNADGSWLKGPAPDQTEYAPVLATSYAVLTLELLYHRL